jgi:FkbM family methyltransferase
MMQKRWLKKIPFLVTIYRAGRQVWHPRPWHEIRNESYDKELVEIMKRTLSVGSTCIDIGANRGSLLQHMFQVSPSGRHFAFEPIPELAQELVKTFPHARIFQCALGDQNTTSQFYHLLNGDSESGLRKTITHAKDPQYRIIEVEVKRLDDIVSEELQISLIKIDTEGNELPIIRGAEKLVRRCKPLIIFETGGNTTTAYDVTWDEIYSEIVYKHKLKLSTMKAWLTGGLPYTEAGFRQNFDDPRGEFYFIAYP